MKALAVTTVILLASAALSGCNDDTSAPRTQAPSVSAEQRKAENLRRSAPEGPWKLVRLTADDFTKDYGFWYLEDESFKSGQSLLSVPSVDVKFTIDDCSPKSCRGSITPVGESGETESKGHLYPWAGQKHSFAWDGRAVELVTHAEKTHGICYDVETGKDLPDTSWTDTATYKYSDVTYTAAPDGVAESIDAKMRVDYTTEFYPACEGPTSMFLDGSIRFEQASD